MKRRHRDTSDDNEENLLLLSPSEYRELENSFVDTDPVNLSTPLNLDELLNVIDLDELSASTSPVVSTTRRTKGKAKNTRTSQTGAKQPRVDLSDLTTIDPSAIAVDFSQPSTSFHSPVYHTKGTAKKTRSTVQASTSSDTDTCDSHVTTRTRRRKRSTNRKPQRRQPQRKAKRKRTSRPELSPIIEAPLTPPSRQLSPIIEAPLTPQPSPPQQLSPRQQDVIPSNALVIYTPQPNGGYQQRSNVTIVELPSSSARNNSPMPSTSFHTSPMPSTSFYTSPMPQNAFIINTPLSQQQTTSSSSSTPSPLSQQQTTSSSSSTSRQNLNNAFISNSPLSQQSSSSDDHRRRRSANRTRANRVLTMEGTIETIPTNTENPNIDIQNIRRSLNAPRIPRNLYTPLEKQTLKSNVILNNQYSDILANVKNVSDFKLVPKNIKVDNVGNNFVNQLHNYLSSNPNAICINKRKGNFIECKETLNSPIHLVNMPNMEIVMTLYRFSPLVLNNSTFQSIIQYSLIVFRFIVYLSIAAPTELIRVDKRIFAEFFKTVKHVFEKILAGNEGNGDFFELWKREIDKRWYHGSGDTLTNIFDMMKTKLQHLPDDPTNHIKTQVNQMSVKELYTFLKNCYTLYNPKKYYVIYPQNIPNNIANTPVILKSGQRGTPKLYTKQLL